jgi:hypothetical protein
MGGNPLFESNEECEDENGNIEGGEDDSVFLRCLPIDEHEDD